MLDDAGTIVSRHDPVTIVPVTMVPADLLSESDLLVLSTPSLGLT